MSTEKNSVRLIVGKDLNIKTVCAKILAKKISVREENIKDIYIVCFFSLLSDIFMRTPSCGMK